MKKQNDIPLSEGVFASTISELRAFMNETFATKEDMAMSVANLEEGMNKKLDKQDENIRKFKNQILTGQDKILKELEDIRQDNAASILHFERNDESVANHEKRITALETSKN